MNRIETITMMNELGKNRSPFFFMISFTGDDCRIFTSETAAQQNILFNFKGLNYNYPHQSDQVKPLVMSKYPVPFEIYNKSFEIIQKHLNRGNSYLVNLTFPTPVHVEHSLKAIFHSSSAKYKIYFQDHFVAFSPETFVTITNGRICTYPMKGTINSLIPNAETLLLENKKELAEHVTIVDLLRNDLSRVASKVKVDKFRYIDKINTNDKVLLQVSSEISGELPTDYTERIGSIIFELLPAGSISGAPKEKTLEIIGEAETYQRGFYTGIAGYFDGINLDSCVLIRFIEKRNDRLIYKSGGGITTQSIASEEYQELIDKIYVPVS